MEREQIETKIRTLISSVNDIKHRQSMLSKEENELSTPTLTNLNQVGNLYDMFCAFEDDEGELTLRRKKFMFVMLYLFSPTALAGSKMKRGLREKIASVLGCTCSNISHDYKNASFYYLTYKEFRNDCNNVIKYMLERV